MLRLSSRIALVLAAVSLGGCGGSSQPDATGAKGTETTPPASDTTAEADAPAAAPPAVVADVTRVAIAHVSLGARAGCDAVHRPVTYVRATRTMTWPGCAVGDGADQPLSGYPTIEKTLSVEEGQRAEEALAAITFVVPEKRASCNRWDGEEFIMTTHTATGSSVRYTAFNTNCPDDRVAPKIAAAYEALRTLRN